ncbi:hypothetical protein AWN90_23080 [Nocardia terpenica]|uniref:DNA-binding protein n=1 Tax=Nocardia terpenica TaxID=455432 RepID=A0A161WM66_9NOCA|nr:hypothetical protein AWN90_35340 [Nocardia terpenica]KZM75183.1 hypothetical protein AWN90_23080 [Nocardia terpenica]NQE86908.1 DNA-binding protein [Nocardia terpenica]NQE93438.1 DNA-binding protein [Nocardia terpenica]
MEEETYLRATQLEALTGIPAATWRWWAYVGDPTKPPSFKLSARRRVWKKTAVLAWLADQERVGLELEAQRRRMVA